MKTLQKYLGNGLYTITEAAQYARVKEGLLRRWLFGTDGKPVKLSDLTAKGPLVIYTFIAAFTPT